MRDCCSRSNLEVLCREKLAGKPIVLLIDVGHCSATNGMKYILWVLAVALEDGAFSMYPAYYSELQSSNARKEIERIVNSVVTTAEAAGARIMLKTTDGGPENNLISDRHPCSVLSLKNFIDEVWPLKPNKGSGIAISGNGARITVDDAYMKTMGGNMRMTRRPGMTGKKPENMLQVLDHMLLPHAIFWVNGEPVKLDYTHPIKEVAR